MTKEIIEKICRKNTPLEVNDISVEEKKNLAEFLAAKGFTTSTFYLRFFQKLGEFNIGYVYYLNFDI